MENPRRRTRRLVLLRIAALGAVILLLTGVAYSVGWFDVRHATTTIEHLQSGHDRISVAVLFFLTFAATTAVGFPALPIGILPATIVFAYFADSLVRGLQGARTHAYWDVGIASAVLFGMSMVPVAAKRVRR